MIYFFGDSFVDKNSKGELTLKHFGIHDGWFDMASKKMNQENMNFGICGSGPQDAMRKYIKLFENNIITSKDYVVMVLSHPYRLPMRWGKNNDDSIITGAGLYEEYLGKIKFNNHVNVNFSMDEKQLYCLSEIYENMKWELAMMNFKNIQLLNHISHKHKIKTIVFTVFEQAVMDKDEIVLNKELYHVDRDDFFYVYPKSLFEISMNEWIEGQYEGHALQNHLSKFAHEILSNIVVNFFNDTKLTEIFKESIMHSDLDLNENFMYE